MGDRCTGHCCKVFPLPGWTPEQLAESLTNGQAARNHSLNFWAHNAVPLGTFKALPRPGEKDRYPEGPVTVYTCKKFDAVSGNCTDYENRPNTCSEYPYQHYCQVHDCASSENRPVCVNQMRKPYKTRQMGLTIGVKSNVRVPFATRYNRFTYDDVVRAEVGTPALGD